MKKIASVLIALACASLSAAQAQNVRQVSLTTNDIIYDSHTSKIYASVPSSIGTGGNSITPINPFTGALGASVFVGSEPDRLALSDDGSVLYVALDGASAIRPFDTATQTPGLRFSYGSGSVRDMQVAPAEPATVAVALGSGTGHDGNAGIVVFQSGVAEPDPPFQNGIYELNSLAFGSSTRLYGYDNYSSGFEFARLTLGSNALSIQDHIDNLVTGYGVTIKYDSGLVYASSGAVIDPEAETLVGTCSGASPFFGGSVCPDAAKGRVFFLSSSNYSSGQSGTATINAYDATTFLPTGSLTIRGVVGTVSSLILYGANGLAFRTSDGQVFLIDSRDLPGLASLTLSAANLAPYFSATGTVTLTQPAPAGGITVALSSPNGQAVTLPGSVTVPAGAQSATFPLRNSGVFTTTDVTITASYGVQSSQAALAALDTAGDADYPAGVRVVNLPANDLIYNPVTAKIYASVPSSAVGPGSSPGNSIVALDPVTGAMDAPVFIGSEPGKLALSDNGQSLFVGLNGAAAVRRLDLPTGLADPLFHLGSDANFGGPFFPADIQALPGTVNSVAVSKRVYVFSPSEVGVGIYDNGIPRPNALGQYPYQVANLAFSASASRLYASNGGLVRLNVNSSGVTAQDAPNGISLAGAIKFDSGLLFSADGKVVDPEAATLSGTFTGVGSGASVRPDVTDRRVFFVSSNGYGGTAVIQAFDPDTFLPAGSLTVPNIAGTFFTGPSSLIRWGADGLAFRTGGGQIFLIRTSLIPNAQPTPASVTVAPARVIGGSAATGTVTLSAPAPSGGVTVWLSSSNSDVASPPAILMIAAGQTSATFAVTTRPVTLVMPTTISAVSGGVVASAPLTVQPAPSSHTHLLWTNPNGRVILWSVAPDSSFTYHVFGPYTDGSTDTPWHATALATGLDGLSHILWTNPDGRVILWTVDDAGNFTYQVYGPYTDGSPNTPWSAKALAIGPDNAVRILWTNPNGRVILWNVDRSLNITYQVYGPYTDGSPGTPWNATDLTSGYDGLTRLVWNNPDGRVILWNVDGSFHFTSQVYGPYTDGSPNTPWSAKALSVGPDDIAHLLWNNPDGRVILWNVDSAFHFTNHLYGPYNDGSAGTPWNASALATGPDDFSRLLWTNLDGRVILWTVDPAFNFTYHVYGPYNDGSRDTPWSAIAVSVGP